VEQREPEADEPDEPERPPGHFMDEQLAEDTARFLAEVKRLAARRANADAKRGDWSR
jgi:hypothetical protein